MSVLELCCDSDDFGLDMDVALLTNPSYRLGRNLQPAA
jgi:hypothetical protein